LEVNATTVPLLVPETVIAALAASSAAFGQSTSPPADKLAVAQIEGWVALPLKQLSEMTF
jgi:hypothetical protein